MSKILSHPLFHGRERVVIAAAVSALLAAFFFGASSSPGHSSDLDQVWHGSRAILRGLDPYSVVGRGLAVEMDFPLYYPLPTLIAFLPLALLPLELARVVFVGGSAALLAYAVTATGWHRLLIFASGAYIASYIAVQWAPLLTAAFLLPWLGPVLLLKPNIGLALLAATPSRKLLAWSLLGGGVLVLISLVIDATWPARWLALVRAGPHFTPPVLYLGGPLVLLALLRWRRPEARLLVAMACVPHTTLPYESLPLLLVASNWKESLLLATLSFVTLLAQFPLDTRLPGTDPAAFTEWVNSVGSLMVLLLYLPATILVLRRTNEGTPPAWLAVILDRLTLKDPAPAEGGLRHQVDG